MGQSTVYAVSIISAKTADNKQRKNSNYEKDHVLAISQSVSSKSFIFWIEKFILHIRINGSCCISSLPFIIIYKSVVSSIWFVLICLVLNISTVMSLYLTLNAKRIKKSKWEILKCNQNMIRKKANSYFRNIRATMSSEEGISSFWRHSLSCPGIM